MKTIKTVWEFLNDTYYWNGVIFSPAFRRFIKSIEVHTDKPHIVDVEYRKTYYLKILYYKKRIVMIYIGGLKNWLGLEVLPGRKLSGKEWQLIKKYFFEDYDEHEFRELRYSYFRFYTINKPL